MEPRPTAEDVLAYVRARQRTKEAELETLRAIRVQKMLADASQEAWRKCKFAPQGLYIFDNNVGVNVDVLHDYPELMEIVKP